MYKIVSSLCILIFSLLASQEAVGQNNNGDSSTKSIFINHEKSHIEILGKTNINQFTCSFDIATLKEKNTVHLTSQTNQQQVVGGKIQLRVDDFQCDNTQMTNDFKDLLQYKTHPYITVQVLKITNTSLNEFKVETSIRLAGKEQYYTMRLNATTLDNTIHCTGKQEICISDFGLVAPEKFFGMVKVSEDINISFYLVLEII